MKHSAQSDNKDELPRLGEPPLDNPSTSINPNQSSCSQ